MPFDGISFTEPGYKLTPPSEMNIRTEMSSQAQAKNLVKKLDESHTIQPDGKNKNNSQDKNPEESAKNEDELYEENSSEFTEKTKQVKKYKVSFNQSTDTVELIERETGKIVETISPKDLLTLVSKSKTASGLLVDRKI